MCKFTFHPYKVQEVYIMKKIYIEEQRNEILQRYRSGEKISSICEDTGIAKSTLYAWTKSINKKKNKAINMSDFRILRQRCETLEKMVEVLQLSPCPVSAPLHDRYQVIKDLSGTYSVNLLCQALKAAKGSYYNNILRNANENTSFMRKKKEITPIIEEIFNESNQIFGASKINAILRSRGYVVADKTVAAIMHEITKETLAKAYYDRNQKEGLLFHRDRGANYTSRSFSTFCKTLGITQSLSRTATPYDNSVMEAFFKSLKAEELYRNNYHSEREFRERVQKYIDFYNDKRPHQINRYRTPNATEEAYYKRHADDISKTI